MDLEAIEFSPKFLEEDNNGKGKVPKGNLTLVVEDIEPDYQNSDRWFVRAELIDEATLAPVIYTPFTMDKVDDFICWWEEHYESVEKKIFESQDVKKLLDDLDFRKLPQNEKQTILDEKNGIIDLFKQEKLVQENPKVKVFSENNSLESQKVKNFLLNQGIDFQEINVFEHPEEIEEIKNSRGLWEVPVTKYNNKERVIGFEPKLLREIVASVKKEQAESNININIKLNINRNKGR